MTMRERTKIWLLLGVAVGVGAVAVSVLAAGAGDGTYLPAKLLFPYTMLLTRAFGVITRPLIALALAQFPIYGALVGVAARRRRLPLAASVLGVVHVVAVGLCLILLEDGAFDP